MAGIHTLRHSLGAPAPAPNAHYLTFENGFFVTPGLTGIRTVRMLFRVLSIGVQRADFLFDLDSADNSYSGALDGNYGEFGGFETNLPLVYQDGTPLTQTLNRHGHLNLAATPLFDGAWHQVVAETDAPVSDQPWFLTRSGHDAPYLLNCQLAYVVLYNRILTAAEKASSGRVTGGILAHYTTQLVGNKLQDVSGHGRHATLYGALPLVT